MSTISTYLQTPTLTLTANPCQLIHISHQHCTAFTVRVRVRASNTKPLSTHTYLHINIVQHSLYVYVYVLQTPNPCQLIHIYTSALYSIHCTCTCTCFKHQTLVNSYISHINIVQHSLYVYVYVLQTPNPCQLIHISPNISTIVSHSSLIDARRK